MGYEGGPKPVERKCPKCGGDMIYRTWESSDGGHEDYHIECTKCVYHYWIDGIDS